MPEDLAQPDGRFSKHMLEHYSPQHILIAEGEGARSVISLLTTPVRIIGRTDVYYVDTVRDQSPGFVDSLRSLDVTSLQVFAARLELLRRLPAIFSQSSPPLRVYISACEWFIAAAEQLAENAGIVDEQITTELCEPTSRRVCCIRCGKQMISQADESLACDGCGQPLQITGYYRLRDHVHLAIPADWPAEPALSKA